MKSKIIYLIALCLLMLVTGVFWGTWFTLTRSIEEFSAAEFIHIGKVIIANVAVPMRFILPSCLLFMILPLWFYQNKRSVVFYTGLFSFLCLAGVLLITLIVLVPMDNEIKTWTAATVPDEWEDMRHTWKIFHASRTFASLIGFATFAWFTLSAVKK